MEKLRIMSVFGTRPEAIKMAPLVKELASRDEIESLCCVTAQHREMLDSVMEVFDLKADCDLDIMTPRQTLSTITSKCLLGMDDAIEQLKPDMILVRRHEHDVCRCALGLLPQGVRRTCGGGPSHLRQILPVPRGDEP